MSRHRGKHSQAFIDRSWPHQVAIHADRCKLESLAEQQEFCRTLSAGPVVPNLHYEDQSYVVRCFAVSEDAQAYMDRFGGELFDPRDRGKGREWFKWNKGKAALKQKKS